MTPEEKLQIAKDQRNSFQAEASRAKRNLEELATAAERLLATTPAERHDPSVWFPRVDALKLAIKVARGEIPHGRDTRHAWDEARDGIF
jgi:hypothetical protein